MKPTEEDIWSSLWQVRNLVLRYLANHVEGHNECRFGYYDCVMVCLVAGENYKSKNPREKALLIA